MASVGSHIRRLRTAKHMTQKDLAEKLFVTRQAVSARETGKSLPDVETLERIAASLDAKVTEVISGVPQTPDLRRLKRRWALIGGKIVIISAISFIILHIYSFIGTWRYGLRYQFWNQNYAVTPEGLASMRANINGIQLPPVMIASSPAWILTATAQVFKSARMKRIRMGRWQRNGAIRSLSPSP